MLRPSGECAFCYASVASLVWAVTRVHYLERDFASVLREQLCTLAVVDDICPFGFDRNLTSAVPVRLDGTRDFGGSHVIGALHCELLAEVGSRHRTACGVDQR